MDTSYNKFDLIIIIVLSLLVAFIIGFNIIQLIDNKLSSVTINVPPQKLPPIYLSDREGHIKQINYDNNTEPYDNLTNNTKLDESISEDNEYFGNLNNDYNEQTNPNIIAGIVSQGLADQIINSPTSYDTQQDKDFNDLNHVPVLISPDPPGPNQVPSSSPSYYQNRVKLIDNPDSPLLKLFETNNSNRSCRNKIPEVNGTFDGYNAFENLRKDSYANITSIGKGMLTPYSSFPIPS
jgi:hypothetical protein